MCLLDSKLEKTVLEGSQRLLRVYCVLSTAPGLPCGDCDPRSLTITPRGYVSVQGHVSCKDTLMHVPEVCRPLFCWDWVEVWLWGCEERVSERTGQRLKLFRKLEGQLVWPHILRIPVPRRQRQENHFQCESSLVYRVSSRSLQWDLACFKEKKWWWMIKKKSRETEGNMTERSLEEWETWRGTIGE